MAKNLYQETFSHVRSSYEIDVEDFERMKTKRKAPVGKILLIAAVAAVLAAFGITAAATDFFGINSVAISDGKDSDGIISLLGFADSPEYKALCDYYGGLTLEEAAEKYGLTVAEQCEVFGYEELARLLGGEPADQRNTRFSFILYEDGTFSGDQEFTASDGTVVSYQMFRSVKGSLIDVSLNDALGDDYQEWDVKIGSQDVGLVLGSGDRSLIVADLGDSFFVANVLSGKRADPTFGGPITREQLEELAKSLNWDVLSRVVVPELPPEESEVVYGAGVELDPQYIDDAQSFTVTLGGYGETHFITYLPTPEYGDVRFFLSSDGRVSDYEFHPMFNDNGSVDVAAVSFEDLTGDGRADVLVLVDYVTKAGREYRDIRIFTCDGGGEYEMDWDLRDSALISIPEGQIDVSSVRQYCKRYFSEGIGEKNDAESQDHVVVSRYIQEGERDYILEAIGKRQPEYDRWGIREIRVYAYGADGKREEQPTQVIPVTDAGEDFLDGIYAGYTDCWDKDDVITVLDMNFDGFDDIGVFGWVTNNTIPYYYWFWDSGVGRFSYALTLQGVTLDKENRQVMAEYKSGPAGAQYTRDYYEPDGSGALRLVDTKIVDYSAYYEPGSGGLAVPKDYEGVLANLQSKYDDDYWLNYGLFDLTGDGYEELIATYGTCEADAEAGVWSMAAGELRKLGTFSMGHSRLYVEDGKLIRVMGQMGYEHIDEIGFDGTEATETLVSVRQLGPGEEYAAFGTPFEMSPDSELWLLHGTDSFTGFGSLLDDYPEGSRYALFDMDADGSDELIVESNGNWSFWATEDGRTKYLGMLLASKSSLHESEGHSLILFYSNMSGAELQRVFLDGEKIDTVYVTGWEWKEGVAGEDPGREIEFFPISDRSLLK